MLCLMDQRPTPLPCAAGKMISPVLEEYARTFPDVKFYKVDIDKDAVSSSVAAAGISAVVRRRCSPPARGRLLRRPPVACGSSAHFPGGFAGTRHSQKLTRL